MQAMKLAGVPMPAEVPTDAQTVQTMQGLSGAPFDRVYLEG